MNRTISITTGLSLALCGMFSRSFAQHGSATQRLTFEVRPITSIAVSENPAPMVIASAPASGGVQSVRDRSTRYCVLSNVDNVKISASIDRPMPRGTSLLIRLESTNGRSRGEVDISKATAPADVVTGIGKGTDNNQSIEYTFVAGPGVNDLPARSRTVVLTITD